MEDSQREITSLRHDLKKHLHSLVVFLKAGQYEEALTYIEQIYESANGMKVPLTGGNSMVNILVNNAQQQAAAGGGDDVLGAGRCLLRSPDSQHHGAS